jgi:hypothetical protein
MRIGTRPDEGPTGTRGGRPDAARRLALARSLVPLVGCVREAAPDPGRAAQVEILRNAVAAGRYRPDLRAVARALLAELQG